MNISLCKDIFIYVRYFNISLASEEVCSVDSIVTDLVILMKIILGSFLVLPKLRPSNFGLRSAPDLVHFWPVNVHKQRNVDTKVH